MGQQTAIDLYCGAGGVTQALKQYFNIICSVEYDIDIAQTYIANHTEEHILVRDITTITDDEWKEKVKLSPGELDLLVGTPPCQGFSKHSRKKSAESKDERNNLIFEVIRVSDLFHPKFIWFENVTNIINFPVFHQFLSKLANLDSYGYKLDKTRPSYHIRYECIDAKNYGVPQKRKRLILLAKRIEDSELPKIEATLMYDDKGSCPKVKTPLAIWPAENPAPTLGQHLSKYHLKPIPAGGTDSSDPLHTACSLSELNLKRIIATPKNGGSRDSWTDESLFLKCHSKPNVSYGDVYGRMCFDQHAPTITCGCTRYTKGRFGHPIEDRAISLREAALIQTFPKDYIFVGSNTNIATQIGNAVPVELANSFIRLIHQHINK